MEPHSVYSGHSVKPAPALRPVASSLADPIQAAATTGAQKVYNNMADFQNETYDRMEYTLDQQRKQYIAETIADIQYDSTRRLALGNGAPDGFYDEKGIFKEQDYKNYIAAQQARLDGLEKGYLRPDSSRAVKAEIAQLKQKIVSSIDLKIASNLGPRAREATLKLARWQEEQGDYDLARATIEGSPDYAMSPIEKHMALTGLDQAKIVNKAKEAVRKNDLDTFSAIVSDHDLMGKLTPKQQETVFNLEREFQDMDGSYTGDFQLLNTYDDFTPPGLSEKAENVTPSGSKQKQASQIVGLPLGVTDSLVNLYNQMGGNFKDGEAKRQAVAAIDTFASSHIHPDMTEQDTLLFYNICDRFNLDKSEAELILNKYRSVFGLRKDFDFNKTLKNINPNYFTPQAIRTQTSTALSNLQQITAAAPAEDADEDDLKAYTDQIKNAEAQIAALKAEESIQQAACQQAITKRYADWYDALSPEQKAKITDAELKMKTYDIADAVMDETNKDTGTDTKWDFSSSTEYQLATDALQDQTAAREAATKRNQILKASTLDTDKRRVEAEEESDRYQAAAVKIQPSRLSVNFSYQDAAKLPDSSAAAYLAVPKGDPLAGKSLTIQHNLRTRILQCREANVPTPTLSTRARINFGLKNDANLDIIHDAKGKAIFFNNAVPKKDTNMYQIMMAQETGSTVAVHNLPAADGGGKWEVAGINERYHPEEAAKLRRMVENGASQEKLTQEVYSYYAKYTQPAADLIGSATPSKGLELFMRDCHLNHPPTAPAMLLRRALNVPQGTNLTKAASDYIAAHGELKLLEALSNARANYYMGIIRENPSKAIFRDGWLNRNRNITRAAYNLINAR